MAAKVLITGGTGFIGSNITYQLLEQNIEPILIDANISYTHPGQVDADLHFKYQQARWESIIGKVPIIRCDVRDKDTTRRIIKEHRPTHIIHLAAMPLANISNQFAEEAVSSIFQSTTNLLEIIRDVDFVERFVYTSSSMTYGDFNYVPADEEHTQNPKELYGGSKLAGEIITKTYHRAFDIPYTIIRPSAVYGPTDINRRVVQIFVENALKGKPLKMRGADETKLDFTYVTDTARGFILATLNERGLNETFNITRGEGRSLRELATIIKQHLPEVEVIEQPTDKSVPLRGALDISKATELLGYEPEYNLEKGIPAYIDSVRSFL